MFVTFEGVDGSGKSTQAELLAEWLARAGRTVLADARAGRHAGRRGGARSSCSHGDEMTPWTEAALFAAARAEHVARAIRPALERGEHVVCDRYLDSSVAYQGIARGLGEELVRDLSLTVTGGLLPERTFLLLVDPDEARRRARRRPRPDRARGPTAFMQRVDDAYRVARARRAGAYRRARRRTGAPRSSRGDP